MIFAGMYLFLLIMVLILSLAMPLENGKGYFTAVTILFSILSVATIAGIIAFFAGEGLFPEAKCYSPVDK